jgi:hypothetical protein
MQLPPPSQTLFVPQAVPPLAFEVVHTAAPVPQATFPGLQVVPQSDASLQAMHCPVGSQTIPVVPPQVVPGAFIFWPVQTPVPVLQSKVPGLQSEPHIPPIVQVTQLPFPSHT